MNSLLNPLAKTSISVPQAIVWSGIVVGVLDALDGVVAFGLLGMNPMQVLQYIASGALGPSAFQGGWATAGLGVLLHFFIAFVVAAIYVLASRFAHALRLQPVAWGLLYGALVYLVMTYGVLPLSAVGKSAFSPGLFLNGIIGHALFVGLPIALYARRATNAGHMPASPLPRQGGRI
jgi:uncharacterized membrane protein YagU involved in acid resistance